MSFVIIIKGLKANPKNSGAFLGMIKCGYPEAHHSSDIIGIFYSQKRNFRIILNIKTTTPYKIL